MRPVQRMGMVLEVAVVDSGVGVAATAAVLLGAASHALGGDPPPGTLALVFLGSLGVYLLDRLRDLQRDRVAHPARSAHLAAHRPWVSAVALVCVGGAGWFTWQEPRAVQALLAGVFLLASVHHWIKGVAWFKPLYIALSWWAVTVGVPLAHHLGRVADPLRGEEWATVLPLGLAIGANVLACDAADREAEALRYGPRRVWWIARGMAGSGATIGFALGGASALLAPIPLCVALSLALYRPTPRWTSTVVDGALLVGGVISVGLG